MRKAALFMIVLILPAFMGTMTVSAAGEKINVVGAVGVATSGFDDLLVDLGVEIQLVQKFYFRFVANTHIGGGMGHYDSPFYPSYSHSYYLNPGISFSGTSLHGLNGYGVYKLSLSKKLNLFAKAGISFMFYSTYDFDSLWGVWRKSSSTSGFGAGFGTGIEFIINDKVGLVLGSTYKKLFKENPPEVEWFKFYGGVNVRVK